MHAPVITKTTFIYLVTGCAAFGVWAIGESHVSLMIITMHGSEGCSYKGMR